MSKHPPLTLPRGTYALLAEELGYTASYVAAVARGKRRNALIENRLLQEALKHQRLQQRKRRLKRLTKHGKNT